MIIIITNHNIKNTGRAEMRILLSSSQVGRWLSLAVGAVPCSGALLVLRERFFSGEIIFYVTLNNSQK